MRTLTKNIQLMRYVVCLVDRHDICLVSCSDSLCQHSLLWLLLHSSLPCCEGSLPSWSQLHPTTANTQLSSPMCPVGSTAVRDGQVHSDYSDHCHHGDLTHTTSGHFDGDWSWALLDQLPYIGCPCKKANCLLTFNMPIHTLETLEFWFVQIMFQHVEQLTCWHNFLERFSSIG